MTIGSSTIIIKRIAKYLKDSILMSNWFSEKFMFIPDQGCQRPLKLSQKWLFFVCHYHSLPRLFGESGNLFFIVNVWIPVFTGMTKKIVFETASPLVDINTSILCHGVLHDVHVTFRKPIWKWYILINSCYAEIVKTTFS